MHFGYHMPNTPIPYTYLHLLYLQNLTLRWIKDELELRFAIQYVNEFHFNISASTLRLFHAENTFRFSSVYLNWMMYANILNPDLCRMKSERKKIHSHTHAHPLSTCTFSVLHWTIHRYFTFVNVYECVLVYTGN